MFAAPIVAGAAGFAYGKHKFDDYRKRPVREQFSLKNVAAPSVYFPHSVEFFGRVQLLNINAQNPVLEPETATTTDASGNVPVEGSHANDDNAITQPGSTEEEPTVQQHIKRVSERGMKWFTKFKTDAIEKAKKEYDLYEKKRAAEKERLEREQALKQQQETEHEKQAQSGGSDLALSNVVDDEKKGEEECKFFSAQKVAQHTQPSFPAELTPFLMENAGAAMFDDIICQNTAARYKWKQCEVYLIAHCLYIRVVDGGDTGTADGSGIWSYVSLFDADLEFIPLSINNCIESNDSYFVWRHKQNEQYLVGRAPTVIGVDADGDGDHKTEDTANATQTPSNRVNFVYALTQCKTEIIGQNASFTDFLRVQWIMRENMLVANKDVLDDTGNMSLIYHRNEFELDLKLLLTGKEDIRGNHWGRFETAEVCELPACNTRFGTFQRPHHCYVCGRVICDNCGKNTFKNPINDLDQRACDECFTKWYPLSQDKQKSVLYSDVHDVVNAYVADPQHQFQWSAFDAYIYRHSAILCHWIYDGLEDEKLISLLGFTLHKLVKYGQESQQTQYAFVEPTRNPQNVMYLVYRGSYDVMDWLTNVQTNPLRLSEIGFKVHSGMYCALQQHALDVVIDELCARYVIPTRKKLIIVGHSLGGGYALLSATHILSQQQNAKKLKKNYFSQQNLRIVTFGSPLVLEKDIAESTKIGRVLHAVTTNFINQFDVIPRVGEGISLEYLKKITEKSVDDSMRKVWGLKHVDSMFNLGIQEKIQNVLFEREDVKNMDKVQTEIYGPIGTYYLLMSKEKPLQVYSYGKNKHVFVRQLKGQCLVMPDAAKLLQLLPKRSGLFAHQMFFDHCMNNYLTALYFMEQ